MDKLPIEVKAKYSIKKYDEDGVFLGEETYEEVLPDEIVQQLREAGELPNVD